MAWETLWAELPEVWKTEFEYKGHKDTGIPYPPAEKMAPFSVYTTSAEYSFEGIRFTSVKEWFGALRNEHLAVFRQTIEPFGNIDFLLRSWMDEPDPAGKWKIKAFRELENNACGWLLSGADGREAMLCETTQILSISMKVSESREQCEHRYAITAFEECPIKLEKYISFRTSKEDPDFAETAFKECRQASITGFEFLKGR